MRQIYQAALFIGMAFLYFMAISISFLESSPFEGSKSELPSLDFKHNTNPSDITDRLAEEINQSNIESTQACINVPAGTFLIHRSLPKFNGFGCIEGKGAGISILKLTKDFHGDLFSWSNAWVKTKAGPRVRALTIVGNRSASLAQNAVLLYDHVDQALVEDIDIIDLPGRAIYAGAIDADKSSFLRESRFHNIRLFNDGTLKLPALEITSDGRGQIDGTNEVHISNLDVYASHGPSVIFSNMGEGALRLIFVENLRIEGKEKGNVLGDLLSIGGPGSSGDINTIYLENLQLIDPYKGSAALSIGSNRSEKKPYEIHISGFIGGGLPYGKGVLIKGGRSLTFRLYGLHTLDTNVSIGRNVGPILLDGGGEEQCWSFDIDPSSRKSVHVPALRGLFASGELEAPAIRCK